MPREDSITPSTPPREYFATTRWTVVLAAGALFSPQAGCRAGGTLPHLRVPALRQHPPPRPFQGRREDLTLSFFARFLQKNYLEKLRSEHGEFRSFLLASLKHFLANEWDRAHRQKRGVAIAPLSSIGATPIRATKSNPPTISVLTKSTPCLGRHVARTGHRPTRDENNDNPALFAQLKPFLTMGRGEIPYAGAASASGLSEGAIRVAVHRLRRRYRALLRQEISETLSDPAQAEEEMRTLFTAFAV